VIFPCIFIFHELCDGICDDLSDGIHTGNQTACNDGGNDDQSFSEEGNNKKQYGICPSCFQAIQKSVYCFCRKRFAFFSDCLLIIYGLDVFFSQKLAIERSDKLLKDLDPLNPKQFFMPVLPDFIFLFQGLFQEISEQFCFIRFRKELLKTFPSENSSVRNLPKVFQNIMLKTGRELYLISGLGYFGSNRSGRIILGLDLDIRTLPLLQETLL
jgi:hypothetical protein